MYIKYSLIKFDITITMASCEILFTKFGRFYTKWSPLLFGSYESVCPPTLETKLPKKFKFFFLNMVFFFLKKIESITLNLRDLFLNYLMYVF